MHNLWEYRNLIKKMAVTDLKLRYKNSVLGIVWSLLQPLLMLLVLYLVFSSIFTNRSITYYPLFLLLGIISWGFLEKATNMSLGSVVGKPNLVKKIYFPREILVISACLTALMMTALEFVVFGIFMTLFGLMPTMTALLFPGVIAMEFIFALGISLAIASLNVKFRDVQWIWGVVMQAGFFLTPIIYSLTMFEGASFVELLKYNPMGVIIEMMRGVLIYDMLPAVQDVAYIAAISTISIIIGWFIFSRLEPSFAEEV